MYTITTTKDCWEKLKTINGKIHQVYESEDSIWLRCQFFPNWSIDLIKFYEENYKFKQNIFTSSDLIKINYIARTYSNFTIPSYDNFYYLDNDLRGYATEIIKDDYYHNQVIISFRNGGLGEINYSISFMNNKEEYFNHENSFEIVNSISR